MPLYGTVRIYYVCPQTGGTEPLITQDITGKFRDEIISCY